jgi:hypothetical protein
MSWVQIFICLLALFTKYFVIFFSPFRQIGSYGINRDHVLNFTLECIIIIVIIIIIRQ